LSYKYSQANAHSTISLHDCRATNAVFNSGCLSLDFEDGFVLTSDNTDNPFNRTAYTDASRLVFSGIEEADVYIFREVRLFRKTICTLRKRISLERLAEMIASKKYQFEFIHETFGYRSAIYNCWLWFDRRPYHIECQLDIMYDRLDYLWNTVNCDPE